MRFKCFLVIVLVVLLGILSVAGVYSQVEMGPAVKNIIDNILQEQGVEPEVFYAFHEAVGKPAEPLAVEIEKPIRIAFLSPSADISDAWEHWYWAMRMRLEEAQIPYEVTFHAAYGHAGHEDQLAQVENVITRGADFIVMGPTEIEAQEVSIKKIHEADIPLIILNYSRRLPWDDKTIIYTTLDHEIGGIMVGQWIVNRFGGKGDVKLAAVRGIPGMIEDQRYGGAMNIVEQQTDNIEVVYEIFCGEYSLHKAYEATTDILTAFPDVDVVLTTSSSLGMGAVAAIIEAGRIGGVDRVHSIGFGATLPEQDSMVRKELAASPLRFIDDSGVAAALAIQFYLEGRQNEIPGVHSGGFVMTDDQTTAEEFEEYNHYGMRYSFDRVR